MDLGRQLANLIAGHSPTFPPTPTKAVSSPARSRWLPFLAVIAAVVVGYIVYPTLFPQAPMFSRRPDKYTPGLQNLRNDCFANLSLQAFSALPGLTEYLNEFVLVHAELERYMTSAKILDNVIKGRATTQKAKKGRFDWHGYDVPLHRALAVFMKKLQETITYSKTISVWTFLHSLEAIFNSKILRSQHDAHELTMLIMETLEVENHKLRLFKHYLESHLDQFVSATASDYRVVLALVPDVPFLGLVLLKMQCTKCQRTSKPNFSPFLMMTLTVPQQLSTSLDEMLRHQQQELIDGYHCVVCRLRFLLDQLAPDHPLRPQLTALELLAFINEDLIPEVEDLMKSHRGMDQVVLTVVLTHQIIKPPKIFGIHLLRLTFNGQMVVRNPCRVKFTESVQLLIGPYTEELQHLLELSLKEDIHARVLTTDVNDMENALVQNGLFEHVGTDEALVDVTLLLGDYGDITLLGSDPPELVVLSVLNASKDQLANLQKEFSQFDFNANDVYNYKLKLMIRHQGSHTMGHYECFKRKPTYVKDKDGTIIRLSPEISAEVWQECTEEKLPELPKPQDLKKLLGLKKKQPEIIHLAMLERLAASNIRLGVALPAEIEMSVNLSQLLAVDPLKLKQRKLKKLSLVVKSPYWRILDATVLEVLKEQVLNEENSVYMLYYERR